MSLRDHLTGFYFMGGLVSVLFYLAVDRGSWIGMFFLVVLASAGCSRLEEALRKRLSAQGWVGEQE